MTDVMHEHVQPDGIWKQCWPYSTKNPVLGTGAKTGGVGRDEPFLDSESPLTGNSLLSSS